MFNWEHFLFAWALVATVYALLPVPWWYSLCGILMTWVINVFFFQPGLWQR
jgi:hypothetical protein